MVATIRGYIENLWPIVVGIKSVAYCSNYQWVKNLWHFVVTLYVSSRLSVGAAAMYDVRSPFSWAFSCLSSSVHTAGTPHLQGWGIQSSAPESPAGCPGWGGGGGEMTCVSAISSCAVRFTGEVGGKVTLYGASMTILQISGASH